MTDHNLICIQQALEYLAGFQGYQSAAVDALDRLRGERDRFQAFLEELAEDECFYHDGCPDTATRHGTCRPCKARKALNP